MDQRLMEAAQEGDIDAFYALIREDPRLLERIDEIPFVDSPLHVAASAGHTHFALEIMRLKPSFARKPNPDGFSPIHLALLQNENSTHIVLPLVQVDPDLVRVKGREGITPLHYVTKEGNLDLLVEFLLVCPKSVEDLTIQSETALHVALKNNRVDALEVLVGWLRRICYTEAEGWKEKILNWKDEEGNTVLDIAESHYQFQVVRLLLRAGALRDSSLPSATTCVNYLRSEMSFSERWTASIIRGKFYMSSENRNALLVVAVLIATATYQAGLNPPGGVWQDDYEPPNLNTTHINTTMALSAPSRPPHKAGEAIMRGFDFKWFAILNTTACYMSIAIICFSQPLDFFNVAVIGPLLLLVTCHSLSVSLTSGRHDSSLLFFYLTPAVYSWVTRKGARKLQLLRRSQRIHLDTLARML